MQCLSCTFENFPGASLCARCGSRLDLDDVVIEPPRASPRNTATTVRRTGNRLRLLCPDFGKLWRSMGVINPEPIDNRALRWSFIPGLGHLKTGRRQWGRVLLSVWLLFFMLMIVGIGTHWSWFMLSGMVAVHTLAIVTLFAANLAFETLFMRAAFGLIVFLSFNFFIYQPGVWFCSRFLVVVPIRHSPGGDVIQDGDGLLCEGAWIRPTTYVPGDIVLYQIDTLIVGGIIIEAGYGVNRVVGVPGDHIMLKKGVLSVNDVEPEERYAPLGRILPIGDYDVTLGKTEYAVFRTVAQWNFYQPENRYVPRALARELSIVSLDDILGRVILRIRPLSRIGSLE